VPVVFLLLDRLVVRVRLASSERLVGGRFFGDGLPVVFLLLDRLTICLRLNMSPRTCSLIMRTELSKDLSSCASTPAVVMASSLSSMSASRQSPSEVDRVDSLIGGSSVVTGVPGHVWSENGSSLMPHSAVSSRKDSSGHPKYSDWASTCSELSMVGTKLWTAELLSAGHASWPFPAAD